MGLSRAQARRLLALVCLGLLGCTDREISPLAEEPPPPFDNKLSLSGKICTTDPADLDFPLKVLFIIDTSQSMNITDPVRQEPDPELGETTVVDPTQATGRSRALRDVVSQFIDLGVQYAPQYCNTSDQSCAKGEVGCAACAGVGTAGAVCVGPDCCLAPPCSGVPSCPAPGGTNGVCLPLCNASSPGCGPGERDCSDCPNAGSRCLSGICANQLDPGVEFAFLRFGSAKQVLTRTPDGIEGFTSDPQELVTSLPQVNNGGSVTDYEGALSEAFALLSNDMARTQEDNTSALNRSKYVVIFLSDGQPDPPINESDDWDNIPADLRSDLLGDQAQFSDTISEYNVPTKILRRVSEIMSLRAIYRIGDIKFHTAYLSGDNTPAFVQDQATGLLKQMAQVGEGTFRNFRNGEEINFLHVDFSSLRRVFRLKSLIVSNENARQERQSVLIDSDGDGLHDRKEQEAGTNVSALDTDGDGFSDTLEYFFRASGADALDPTDADCSLAANDLDGDGRPDDQDGDGLFDCEERFLGTNRALFDSDGDGLPDGIEVRFGTNPVSDDVLADLDFDGMPNGDEIQLHTDPQADDAANRSRTSYRYDVQRTGSGVERVGLRCEDDTGCPQGVGCADGFCRCTDVGACSSLTGCSSDAQCPQGEHCGATGCVSERVCEVLEADQLAQDDSSDQEPPKTCIDLRNITCYSYTVDNITLVDPTGAVEDGWNSVYLYFGQVPFDNPSDFGIFSQACVRARFNQITGAKLPATGQLEVPEDAWRDPTAFDPQAHCLCPEGDPGNCPATP